MEFINNFGPIGKHMYKSNVAAMRYLGYFFDEHLTETTTMYHNTHLMVNAKDTRIPDNTTCLLINTKISFERLNRLICDTNIRSVVFFKDMFVENIDTSVVCKNIRTVVCYNVVALNMLERFFPSVRHVFMFRQNETINGQRISGSALAQLPVYSFAELRELHIYSSGSRFNLNAPQLEQLSVYSSYEPWSIDVRHFGRLHTLRVDEKITTMNLRDRKWRVLQFYPSAVNQRRPRSIAAKDVVVGLDLTDVRAQDLILPPSRPYKFRLGRSSTLLGVYVDDLAFFTDTLSREIVGLQVLDNRYPLKMCSLRLTNNFYRYFPFPEEMTQELVERFNVQRQRENLLLIFNFDFMHNLDDNRSWQSWYNVCIETYHRIPIIMQNGQLMLNDGCSDANEKAWPNIVNKVRRECIILLAEEELIYINCSPMRLQTLVDKVNQLRRQKFIITKLWLVTNGFELATKDIEERIDNLVIVHNEVKMYINF